MSEVRPRTRTFLDLYSAGKASAGQIHDFVEAWHDSDESEQRSLSEFLGMTDAEYTVWMASRKALPSIVAARRQGRPLAELVAVHLAELQHAASPRD